MNENPGGTPNPLNPNPLDANPSEPMEEVNKPQISEIKEEVKSTSVVRPVSRSVDGLASRPVESPINKPVENKSVENPSPVRPSAPEPLTEELVTESVMIDSLDPEGRPMEKVIEKPVVEPEKKKKTGLIVGIIVCLFLAVGCGVAAILMLMNNDGDPVAAAMKKFMSGDIPTNTAINGSITFEVNDETAVFPSAVVNINSKSKTGSLINASDIDLTLTTKAGNNLVTKINEVYAESDDLYIKFENVTSEADEEAILNNAREEELLETVDCDGTDCEAELVTNCIDGPEGTNCAEPILDAGDELTGEYGELIEFASNAMGYLFGTFGGEWIRIPSEMLDLSSTSGITTDSDVVCLLNAVKDLSANPNVLADLYNKYPFVASSTENIPISSKLSTVRQITFDDEKLASFFNSAQDITGVSEMFSCLDVEESTNITASDAATVIEQLPAFYVEVNSDNYVTRLYTKFLAEEISATVTVDLSFSYPATINVSAPAEYVDVDEVVQVLLPALFDVESLQGELIEEETIEVE